MAGKKIAGVAGLSAAIASVLFEVGALVALKSGGPTMTVEAVEDHEITAVWLEGDVQKRDSFLVSDLVAVEAEKPVGDKLPEASTVTDPPVAEKPPEAAPVASGKSDEKGITFPIKLKLTSEASMPLVLPDVGGFLPAHGECEITVYSEDQAKRLKADIDQLLYRNGLPADAVSAEAVKE